MTLLVSFAVWATSLSFELMFFKSDEFSISKDLRGVRIEGVMM